MWQERGQDGLICEEFLQINKKVKGMTSSQEGMCLELLYMRKLCNVNRAIIKVKSQDPCRTMDTPRTISWGSKPLLQ